MKIFRCDDVPHQLADPQSFVGSAQTKKLAQADDGAPVIVYDVQFDSGARTNWHAHSGAQWLFILEGDIRVQAWEQPAQDVRAGDAVVVAPGEKHWHGAVPGARGVHLAVNINVTTHWMEPVTEQQYHGD
jgi:quercetin dioxygenase-like cupin family protein